VKSRLPSGVKVNLRKNDFKVSFAYMLAFLIPRFAYGFGEASIGITAGKGSEGAGETDRRIDIAGEAAPNDDLLLWLMVLGGFIGSAEDVGVPGHEGVGEPIAVVLDWSVGICGRNPSSGGAGLLEEILRPGKSIFIFMPILFGSSLLSSVKWPSLVLSVYMWTDRSEDWVAMYSLRGSHVTPCT
jgi:hypothetical protein